MAPQEGSPSHGFCRGSGGWSFLYRLPNSGPPCLAPPIVPAQWEPESW